MPQCVKIRGPILLSDFEPTGLGFVAVHVNGKEQDIGLDTTLPSGLMVSYLNNTIPDGTLWFKPGEWTLPQIQINTPRYSADLAHLPSASQEMPASTVPLAMMFLPQLPGCG